MTAFDLRLGDYRDVLARELFDHVITDAPFSERTHAAYASFDYADNAKRQSMPYGHLSPIQVAEFVRWAHERTGGWINPITDHVLAGSFAAGLEECGRYVFSPIACVHPGSRVRMSGDGPAQWSCWMVPTRPRTSAWSKWGSLPGAYVVPSGLAGAETKREHIGGKPLWLMRQIIRDYSREGQTICDPFAGAGTTGIAAILEGRRFIGAEIDPQTHTRAMERARRELVQR